MSTTCNETMPNNYTTADYQIILAKPCQCVHIRWLHGVLTVVGYNHLTVFGYNYVACSWLELFDICLVRMN